MNTLNTLLANYQTLCQYCDDLFTMTYDSFAPQMRCAKGCASCCLLETVVPLEAHVMMDYLQESFIQKTEVTSLPREGSQEGCVFLRNNECSIYPVRPIICRTHGLAISYPERQSLDACPLNFTDLDLDALEPQFVLDAERITSNLMRLNLAFCLLTQTPEAAGRRIPLAEIFSRAISP